MGEELKKTMRAFVGVGRGQFEMQDVPVPEIGDDDILIQLKAAAICGSDVHIYDGSMDPLCGYPVIMGHENAGIIVKRGKNVAERWQVGDRVTSENTVDVCGSCYACITGDYVACEERKGMGIAADGILAEYVKIPGKLLRQVPDCIFKIPDNVSFEEAPLLEPAANGYKAIFQEGRLMGGENVVVTGAGAIGLYSAHMAAIGGAAHVILMVRKSTAKDKIATALKMGVTDVIYSDEPEACAEEVSRLTDGFGADLVAETTGVPAVMNTALGLLHVKGRLVRIAINDTPYGYGLNSITLRSIEVIGHMGYNTVSWRNTINLASQGKLDLTSIVTHRISLEESGHGFDMMVSREAGKVIVTM